MNCPRCQHENRAGAKFCEECGAPLARSSGAHEPECSYADLTAALSEALDRETATSEILRVISSSPTDVQPVFDAIVRSASRLCSGHWAAAMRFDGQLIHLVAQHNMHPDAPSLDVLFPCPPSRRLPSARAIVDGQLVHIPDAEKDPDIAPDVARRARSFLAVPMMRKGAPIGAIAVSRPTPGPFPPNHIELLSTFAGQAVIAVENVRLFQELEARNRDLTEALDQQTATGEILRVISSSPTDVQPVFETIAANAVRLCGAVNGAVFRFDGELIHLAAYHNVGGDELAAVLRVFPVPPGRGSVTARAISSRAVVHVEDLTKDPEHAHTLLVQAGFRTVLSVPMLREGLPIGTINVTRMEVKPFPADQIELLKTFAEQAVIAIENVRLFTELQEKKRALTVAHAQVTEALERQTATAEILRVISQSQTDVQGVFDTIVRSAVRLCDGLFSGLYRFDGELIHQVAQHNYTPEALDVTRRTLPVRPSRAFGAPRAILERAVVHIPDVELDPEYRQEIARAVGARNLLCVPMLREGVPTGAIAVGRAEAGPFSENQIELLKTFADQAVIAIENARLFSELQARTRDLTRSVEQLTALGDVSHALSSTLDLDAVLRIIVARAGQLAGADACAVSEYDEQTEAFHLRATHDLDEEVAALARALPVRKGEGAAGRVAVTREPVHIADIAEAGAYHGPLRDVLLRSGARALLAIPLLREDHLVGSLTVTRKMPGEFPPETIDLLKTFATQSALAIQNARLFREIADKSRQLEVASQHKSEFLANMSHELRTPLNAIIGFSEVLTERMFGDLNEKQDEYLKDIHASGQHLLSLINDILDLSKIEAGRMELELAHFDLPTAIDNALTLVRERAGRRGIALHQVVDERLGQIRGDERKIKQVLLNLLSNALKFTPEGGRVDVRASVVDGMAETSVTDTGVGIAPQDQEAVFEEFRQVGTAAKKVEGTGLGLALSRKFIELHGGRIWVKSQVGVGSTFTFTIPVRHGERADPDRGRQSQEPDARA